MTTGFVLVEQHRLSNRIDGVTATWQETGEIALRQLKLEQQASESRENLQAELTKVSRDVLMMKLGHKSKAAQ
jgi:hypothetical protein